MKGWLEKIKKPDFYCSPFLVESEKQLIKCEHMLDDLPKKFFTTKNQYETKKYAVYTMLGYTIEGHKEILGSWFI